MDVPIPFAGCFSDDPDPTLPLAFAGLPCDMQSTYRRGAAEGPSRIRLAYDGRCYNATTELGTDIAGLVADVGDWWPGGSWEDTREEYRARAEELLAGEACINLCYQRPRRQPDWPYNLFCMIHGRERAGVLRRLAQIIDFHGLGDVPHAVLFSRRSFKQRGARYANPVALHPARETAHG